MMFRYRLNKITHLWLGADAFPCLICVTCVFAVESDTWIDKFVWILAFLGPSSLFFLVATVLAPRLTNLVNVFFFVQFHLFNEIGVAVEGTPFL